MSELSEAEWMPYIAKKMGFEAKLEIYENKPRCVIKTKGRNWRVFSILTNPADCLAAITFFKIDILWHPNGWAAANFGCEQAETRTTIEAAVFEACKRLVEE